MDYFTAFDVAAAESSPRVEVGEAADLPSASTEYKRRRVVSKHCLGEVSRSGRHRRMGMEHARLRVDRVGKRGLLSSPIGVSIGEGRAGKLARGSRAGSSSERLGSARSGSRASNEPSRASSRALQK